MRIAKATQRPGQSKEQTKLITQGIQKGIEQYKKQQSARERERDKQRKKQERHRPNELIAEPPVTRHNGQGKPSWLPWTLLVLSWLGFVAYLIAF